MKFENAAQLANHVKKFCTNSEYHDLDKLNRKQTELRMGVGGLNANLNGAEQGMMQNLGGMSVSQAKGLLKTQDPSFRQLERVAQKVREEDMQDELMRYKKDRALLKDQRRGDDVALASLMNKYDTKMDIELQSKQRKNVDRLYNQRDHLAQKESIFLNEVGSQVTPQMMGNKNYQSLAMQDRSDKLLNLKEQQEAIDKERFRIMSNLDKVKNNDLRTLSKAGASLIGIKSKDTPSYQYEQYRPMSHHNYDQQNPYVSPLPRTMTRDQIIDQQKNKDWNGHSNNMMSELQKMREDYERAGGNDPKFKQNLDNMEKFYAKVRTHSAQGLNQSYEKHSISPATHNHYNHHNDGNMNNNRNNQLTNSVMMPNYNSSSIGKTASFGGGVDPMTASTIQQLQAQIHQMQSDNKQQHILFQQEQESMRLRQELEAMQRGQQMPGGGTINLPGMTIADPFQQPLNNAIIFGKNGAPVIPNSTQNNYTLSDINSKIHGFQEHGENPFSIFTPQQEFLLQNEVRTVDLDDEERLLANLAKEEVDLLRVLGRIPVGTELYRFKVEQYKELSTVKAEMEKIANEQKLQRARMEFEYERREEDRQFDNEKWNDDQRKWILAQRIRKDLGPVGGVKQYDQNDGFVVHWDYILGLPKRTNFSQVVFGIFNRNDTLYPPKIVDPKECEIFDIPPNPDTLLIMEVQLPYSKKKGEGANKTESYGWTQLDLFDMKKELKRGKFKCPLYYPPTDQAISIHEIKQLEPIPGAWIYLRIAYPNDDDFSKQRSRYPDHTMHEYVIPYIHLRNDLGARQARKKPQPNQLPYGLPDNSQLPNMSYMPDGSQMDDINLPDEELVEPPPDDGLRRGLSVSVLNVANHVADSNVMVSTALMQDNKPVYDDQNRTCSFTTSVHNPFVEERMEDLPLHVVIPLEKQIQKGEMMNNKQFEESIKWNEEYKFLKNIPQLYWSSDRKDIYVGFQVREKDRPKNLNDQAELKSYNGSFNIIGWNFVKVNRPDGSIRSGIYTIDLFRGQFQRPPINEENQQKTGKQITVVIQEFIYDDTFFRKKTPPKSKDAKPKPQADLKPETEDIDNSPYIENNKDQYKTKTFEKRMGIDFYIDGLRYLPDKVTATKVYMQVYNINYEEIFEKETCLPELDSFSFNPVYNFRRELRKDHIDPTSIAVMTVVTIDKATNETRIVGFAAIPLFITAGARPVHPQDQNLSDIFLFSGAYQIPLISQQIKRTIPFSINKIYDLERLPCASILVRIVAAPMDDKGLRALSINDFQDQKVWLEKGLFRPRPLYGKRVYNTSLYRANDAEMDLFPFRALRDDISIKEAAYLIIKGKKINKRFKNTELFDYLDDNIALTDDNKMMDMMYFAKYSQQAGVKFALDGLHQVPVDNQLYVSFFSVNPPFGGFYPYLPEGNESDEDDPEDKDKPEFKNYIQRKADLKNYRELQMNEMNTQQSQTQKNMMNQLPPDTSEVNLSSFFMWDSAAQSPQYNDQWQTFNKTFNRYQCVIVDVKCISFKKVDPQFEDVGWTIVPLSSHDGYVNSGIFQVPLIKGPVNAQFLYELRKRNKKKYQNENRRDRRQPWDLLMEKMQQKRSGLRFLEFTSIICRVLDAQRQGHFGVRFDTDRMDYGYLPQDKKPKYSYNEAVVIKLKEKKKLSTNIPNKESPANFNKKITDACIQGYNLIRYL